MNTPTTSVHSSTNVATHARASSSLTLDLNRLSHFDTQLDALLPHLADLDEHQLIGLATHAQRLETCAFRLRGACVAELRRRIKTRLTGGRGRRDTSGVGIGAQLGCLAQKVGVSVSTLKIDARIHEVFFVGKDDEVNDETDKQMEIETRFAREPSLAREFYVTALTAPDPHAAIHHAIEMRAAATDYSREDFRRDVLALKQTAQPTLISSVEATPKPSNRFRVRVVPEARPVLAELISMKGQPPKVIVAQALLAYYTSLTIPQPIAIPKISGEQSRHPSSIISRRFLVRVKITV
jgi:hypothetical protein